VDGLPLARVTVEFGLPAAAVSKPAKEAVTRDRKDGKDPKKAAPAVKTGAGTQVRQDGPPPPLEPALLDCVKARVSRIKLPRPKEGAVVVSVGVISR
jgi:hypothetical protein